MCLADLHLARELTRSRFAAGHRLPAARRTATLAACSLVALSLAACGSDDSPRQTTAPAITGAADVPAGDPAGAAATPAEDQPAADPVSDEVGVTRTLREVLVGGAPSKACGQLVTQRYVKRAFGGRRGCVNGQTAATRAARIRVGAVVISPEAVASASVRASGGIFAGERLRAELVLQDGTWKLDSLRSNVPVGP